MRVVIDTNVVVSAVLKDRVPEDVIRFVIECPDFEWVVSREILAEYLTVLGRPALGIPKDILDRWESLFARLLTVLEVRQKVDFARDPDDAPFLACALSAGAEYLITGDKDFAEAYKAVNTTVVSVSQFKGLVCDRW